MSELDDYEVGRAFAATLLGSHEVADRIDPLLVERLGHDFLGPMRDAVTAFEEAMRGFNDVLASAGTSFAELLVVMSRNQPVPYKRNKHVYGR